MSNFSIVRQASNHVWGNWGVPQDRLAPMPQQVYSDPRPADTLIRVVSYPYFKVVYRLHAEVLELVPRSGPVILAPSHTSHEWFVALLLERAVRAEVSSVRETAPGKAPGTPRRRAAGAGPLARPG
jgi:hypothetical protein